MRTRPASHQPAVQSNCRTPSGTSDCGRRADWSARRRGRSGPLRIQHPPVWTGLRDSGMEIAFRCSVWSIKISTRHGELAREAQNSATKPDKRVRRQGQAQETLGSQGGGLSRKGQETSVSGHGLDGDTTWTSETSMLKHRILAVLLWVLAAIAAFAISAVWIIDAQSGMVSAWVILPFFWSAAVLSILGHYLAQWRPPIARYLARHRPLAGPRAGAELPG